MPILKWKKGEQCALKELKMSNDNFIPVLELVTECTSSHFFSTVKECFDGPFYFDTARCDDDNRSLLKEFLQYISENNVSAWPLIYVDDVFNGSDKTVISLPRFAVKIPISEDFEGPANDTILSYLEKNMSGKTVDLFLDAGEKIESKGANIAFSVYKDLLSNSGENVEFTRFDIKIFTKLLERFKESVIFSKLAYSDYGVTKFTETELDFKLMKYGIFTKSQIYYF